ncbi:MAG: DsbA family oxidoreductase [Bacillota bacterium]
MRIDVFSDVVCPWCFIGKRRLDRALADAGIGETEIRWHAFQLNPDIPAGGLDRREYLQNKFGGEEAVTRIHERVTQAGATVGIAFQWDRILRSPNTFDAHRLLKLAATYGLQSELKEALFKAYFLDGRDLGDRRDLAAITAETGIRDDIPSWLESGTGAQEVRKDLATAAELQISGVPFFIFAGRYALPGAQPPEVFAQALAAAQGVAHVG